MDFTGNENRKWEYGLVFLDFRPYYLAHIKSLTIRALPYHVSVFVIVRGKLFRSLTVKFFFDHSNKSRNDTVSLIKMLQTAIQTPLETYKYTR